MAGDWIKMRGNLWDDPRVLALCDACDCGEAQIIGALYWLWATADQHTEDGLMPGLTLRQIDRKTGVQGFGAALVAIGWIADGEDGVTLARFDEHNGASAKRRCTDAQRKANSRNVSAFDADKTKTEDGQKAPDCGAREREEKEEEVKTTSNEVVPARQAERSAFPDCPHVAILSLWEEVLPSMPRHLANHWSGARADHLRARWRETAAAKKWATSADGMAYFRRLFAYVGQSDFLTGRSPVQNGRRPFVIELEWLVNPTNWAKVHEGKYHPEMEAA